MAPRPDLYFDRRSPPVRSVFLLIEELKIDINEKPIDLFKGENLSDDFLKVIFSLHKNVLVYDEYLIA